MQVTGAKQEAGTRGQVRNRNQAADINLVTDGNKTNNQQLTPFFTMNPEEISEVGNAFEFLGKPFFSQETTSLTTTEIEDRGDALTEGESSVSTVIAGQSRVEGNFAKSLSSNSTEAATSFIAPKIESSTSLLFSSSLEFPLPVDPTASQSSVYCVLSPLCPSTSAVLKEGSQVAQDNIRLLSKLAYSDEVQGVDGAQNLSVQTYSMVRAPEQRSNSLEEVEFRKKSIEITSQIEEAKQASREKRGGKNAYLWDRIVIKLEQARDNWDKVSETLAQGKVERSDLWRNAAEESEAASQRIRELVQAYILGDIWEIKHLNKEAWDLYYSSDFSTWSLKLEEEKEKVDQLQGRKNRVGGYESTVLHAGLALWNHRMGKKSISINYGRLARSLHSSIEYGIKEAEALAAGKESLAVGYQLASKMSNRMFNQHQCIKDGMCWGKEFSAEQELVSFQLEGDYEAKAGEAQEAGKTVLVLGYKKAIATLRRTVGMFKMADLALKHSNEYGSKTLRCIAESLQTRVGYQVKESEAEEAGQTTLTTDYREAVAISQCAADEFSQSNRAMAESRCSMDVNLKNDLKNEALNLYEKGKSLEEKADYQVRASEAQEAGKTTLAIGYREAAKTLQQAIDQNGDWDLQKTKAEYQAKAGEVEELREVILASGYREAAAILQDALDQHKLSAETSAAGKTEEAKMLKYRGVFLEKKARYQIKENQAQEAGNTSVAAGYRKAALISEEAVEYHQQAVLACAAGKKDEAYSCNLVKEYLLLKAYNQVKAAEQEDKNNEIKNNNRIIPSPVRIDGNLNPESILSKQRVNHSTKSEALSICCEKWLAETKLAEGSLKILSDYVVDVIKRGADYELVIAFEEHWDKVAKAYNLGDYPQALALIQVAEDIQQAIKDSIKMAEASKNNNKQLSALWKDTVQATQKMAEYREKYVQESVAPKTPEIISCWKKIVEESQLLAGCFRKAAEACSIGNTQECERLESTAHSIKKNVMKLEEAVTVLEKSLLTSAQPDILERDEKSVEQYKASIKPEIEPERVQIKNSCTLS